MDIESYIGTGNIVHNNQNIDLNKRKIDQMSKQDQPLVKIDYGGGRSVVVNWQTLSLFENDGDFIALVSDDMGIIMRASFSRINFLPAILSNCAAFVESLGD